MKKIRWYKDTANFIEHSYGLELPLHKQRGYLTPNNDFFVCNATDTPMIDVTGWCLTIEGDGISRELKCTYDDLCKMPQRTVPAFIECAGNQRWLFEATQGRKLNKRPQVTELLWGLGGVGMAEWRGVSLGEILRQAGIHEAAVHVCPAGHDHSDDEGQVRCPMSVEKALDPDTIIALTMNGEPLPPDHGFPARMIVPGWVGTHSIKWLDRITVSTAHQWVYRNTQLYVLSGEQWPQEKYAPAQGAPIHQQSIKSSLALLWPAQLQAGPHRLRGYARSPDALIKKVEWSSDGGFNWSKAELISPNQKYAWVHFAFNWHATIGEHTLKTRASDEADNSQPDTMPFNNGGYLFNGVHAHPVNVEQKESL